MTSSTSELKAEALAWLRFGKRMPAVCTELQAMSWIPDVIGANSSNVIEVEVKVSISDFRADFRNKKSKMFFYKNAGPDPLKGTPNQLFYLIPPAIKEEALRVLEEQFPEAGLLVHAPELMLRDGQNLLVVKPAKYLHKQKPDKRLVRNIILRMGSELCGTRSALHRFKKPFEELLDAVDSAIGTAVGTRGPILDFEDREADLETRAKEIQRVMEPETDWDQLSEEQTQLWKRRADLLIRVQNSVPEEWDAEIY